MNVTWGGNRFSNCVALLAWKDEVMLRVASSPFRVYLRVPSALNAEAELEIDANRLVSQKPNDAQVMESEPAVAVLWRGTPVLMAQQEPGGEVVLHTDFRPLGMNIFDDAAGLHIGGGVLNRNSFDGCSTAIALG